jgi:hypothetical protein
MAERTSLISCSGQGTPPSGFLVAPFLGFACPRRRGSLRSCACVHTCHRGNVPDRLINVPNSLGKGLLLPNGRDTCNFLSHIDKQDSLQLTPQASGVEPCRLAFGVHLPQLPLALDYHRIISFALQH